MCECVQTIVAACGDTGSLSRDFPSPRSIISQTSAWGEREGGRKGEREREGGGGGGQDTDFLQTKANQGVTFLAKMVSR